MGTEDARRESWSLFETLVTVLSLYDSGNST